MKKILLYCLALVSLTNCEQKKWTFEKEIPLDNIHPIGITEFNNKIWVSDGNGNRLVHIDPNGKVLKTISAFELPMHITTSDNGILVPEYGRDNIALIDSKLKRTYAKTPSLDAPAGVASWNNQMAIADFYNHRVLFNNGTEWLTIGQKGTSNGTFNYPTDVQITDHSIYVADAYNHRVQVFSKKGTHIKTIGAALDMNASTGVYVSNDELYITDFENDRVFLTTTEGELIQEINTSVEKPTDIMVIDNKLWILNFKKGSISLYTR